MYNRNNGYGSYNDEPASDYNNFYPRRPTSITVVCIVITMVLIVNLISLLNVTGDPSLSVPLWYWFLTFGQIALIVAGVIGLWLMRKWGAYAYTTNFIINLIIMILSFILQFDYAFVSLIFPIVLLFFIYRKFNEMR